MPQLLVLEAHESQRRKLEELLAALFKKGYALAGKNEASASGGWSALFASCSSRGLFDEKRTTVIEGAEQLGPFPSSFSDLLEGEGAEDVLITVFTSDSKKIFPKEIHKKIEFIKTDEAIPPWKRKEWLLGVARERGYSLAPAAAALLAETIESQEELRSEIEKLALFAGKNAIDVDAVKNLSFDEGGNALLRFLDGVCQNRPGDVLGALKYLQADVSPLPLLTALYNRLRPALYIACSSSKTESRALAAIGATREYALRMARKALENFGVDNLKLFMLKLIRLSYLEKTSFAEGWIGFETVLWHFMGHSTEPRVGR